MTSAQQFHALMVQYHRLRIPERLGLMPHSEHIFLEMLLAREQDGCADRPLNAGCMARRMHISPPAVSRTMRRLRERGLIEAAPDPDDRRGLRAGVTAAGHAAMQADRQRIERLLCDAAARLEPGEFERFLQTFDRLIQSLTAELDRLDDPERKEHPICEVSSEK